ncbi:hypothetical protein BC826DRAFT_983763 [Russula brevipes]|nr:hypothetical protein BC826DRAFT_983763 [Russula brevipes]
METQSDHRGKLIGPRITMLGREPHRRVRRESEGFSVTRWVKSWRGVPEERG